jgi:HemY protein
MTRLIILLIVIVGVSLGLSWLADEPGRVAIDWSVYRIETSVLTLIACIALTALLFVILYWFVFSVFRSPKQYAQYKLAKRQSLGITALTETFAAIAAQDVRGAKRYIKRAENMLPDQPLTLMLASQVARLEGNDAKSQQYLERMGKSGVTEFLSLRGLIENARRAGDYTVALQHAEKAYTMKPHDHWLAVTLVGLLSEAGRTDEALVHMKRAARKRAIHADELHTLRAGLLCTDARVLAEKKQWQPALARLKDALRRNKTFVPAIVEMSQVYVNQSDASMALKVAGDGWKRNLHPEIGEQLIRAYEVAKDKKKAAKIIRKLAKLHKDSDEANVMLARLLILEKDYKAARGILKDLMKDSGETSRLCTLLATIEHEEENHDQEALWYKRAKECPSGADWSCNSCKRPANAWEFMCPQCGSVGSLS